MTLLYSTCILGGRPDIPPPTVIINRAYFAAEREVILKGCLANTIKRSNLEWIEPDTEKGLPGGWQLVVTGDDGREEGS